MILIKLPINVVNSLPQELGPLSPTKVLRKLSQSSTTQRILLSQNKGFTPCKFTLDYWIDQMYHMYKISTLFFPRGIFLLLFALRVYSLTLLTIAYSIISPAKKQKSCSQKSPCPWPDSNLSLLISHRAICFFTNVPANAQYFRLLVVNNPFYYLVANNGIVFSQICEV